MIEKMGRISQTCIKQETRGFTALPNHTIQSIRNPDALALWTYLSSLPHDWMVKRSHLISHFGFTKEKLIKVFRYLKELNLVAFQIEKDKKGQIIRHTTTVKLRISSPPEGVQKPDSGQPDSGQPDSGNRERGHLSITNETLTKQTNTNNKKNKGNFSFDENLDKSFEIFWSSYKRKDNRKRAMKVWASGKLFHEAEAIYERLKHDNETRFKGTDQKYFPLASTYLNSEEWKQPKDEWPRVHNAHSVDHTHWAWGAK